MCGGLLKCGKMFPKILRKVPIFSFEAIGSSSSGFSAAVFLGEIFLNSLDEADWKLPTSRLGSHNTIC
jgi:Na+-translocating ferredoxin:NAD+ oxidoreductase RnfD subunit